MLDGVVATVTGAESEAVDGDIDEEMGASGLSWMRVAIISAAEPASSAGDVKDISTHAYVGKRAHIARLEHGRGHLATRCGDGECMDDSHCHWEQKRVCRT